VLLSYRVCVCVQQGPGSQIFAYTWFKEQAGALGLAASSSWTHGLCSLASAAVSVACVNPVDLVRTRMYNQPFGPRGEGLWYRHGADAAFKVVSVEGPWALYKGAGAHYARLGPHMVLVFVILEQLKAYSN
jgi:solute carrier family 25 protein 34/35